LSCGRLKTSPRRRPLASPNADLASDFDRARVREVGVAAARAAGQLLRERIGSIREVRHKGVVDLVTDVDVQSERDVSAAILSAFPTHTILGEEGGAHGGSDARFRWIVDPLDGTTNYVHDCPLYCVSIGLLVGSELVVGVVYDPRQQEMFSAARGMGAWLGERRISVSKIDRLEEALLSTGFAPDLRGQERTLDWWRYFSFRTQSLRRTGSTALNLAYVACGRFDGYWAFDNHPWDVAGGFALVQEAGGTLSRSDGSPIDLFEPDSLVTNGRIHAAMLQALRKDPRQL